jgi:tetratricopeptide (TPR) repeat protein
VDADQRFDDYVAPPLPEFLSDLVHRKASGILTAMGVEAHRGIVLVNGEVKAARSTLEKEKLGLFLVGKHWLDEKDRAQALLTQATADAPPLGEVLIARGFISASELEEELQELALTIIRRAASDQSAYAEFFDDPEGIHLDTLTFLTTTQVLLNAARAFEDDEAKSKYLGDRTHRVYRAQNLDVPLEDLEVTPTEAFFLSRADTKPRLQDLIQGASLPEDQAIATTYSLAIAGLITLEEDTPETIGPESEPADTPESVWTEEQRNERVEIENLAKEAPRTDHYQALGVSRTATDQEIIDAWTSIRKRYASSRTSEPHLADAGPWLETIQDRAQDAFHVLGKPATRRRYNTVLADVEKDRSRRLGEPRIPEVDPEARTALVEANLKRADELIRDGEIFSALQMLEQACTIEARPIALLKLAQLQLKNPKWDTKALRSLQKALEVDPNFVDGWVELADFWERRGETERLQKALERVSTLNPDHPRVATRPIVLSAKGPLSRLRDMFRLKKDN